jgi:hypothetical protein
MAKAIAILMTTILFLIITIGASIVGMIHGWGIEPKNWWVIALSYIGVLGAAFSKGMVDAISDM